eukprot:6465551-Amphidinium_carterae.2
MAYPLTNKGACTLAPVQLTIEHRTRAELHLSLHMQQVSEPRGEGTMANLKQHWHPSHKRRPCSGRCVDIYIAKHRTEAKREAKGSNHSTDEVLPPSRGLATVVEAADTKRSCTLESKEQQEHLEETVCKSASKDP